jgi:hypothetical protein
MSDIQIDPISKEAFEQFIDTTGGTVLTPEEWEKVSNEIEGRVENYLDGLLADIVEDYKDGNFGEEE